MGNTLTSSYFLQNFERLKSFWKKGCNFIVTIDDPENGGEAWSSQSLYLAVKYKNTVPNVTKCSVYVDLPFKIHNYLDQTIPNEFQEQISNIRFPLENNTAKVLQGIVNNQDVSLVSDENLFYAGQSRVSLEVLKKSQSCISNDSCTEGENLGKRNGLRIALKIEQRNKIEIKHKQFLNRTGHDVYGADTKFGVNANEFVFSESDQNNLQYNLSQYLDCGTGNMLEPATSRAVFFERIHVLSLGHSCISPKFLETAISTWNFGIAPIIFERGSLGASGDLISMAPLARLLLGEKIPFWDKKNKLIEGQSIQSYAHIEPASVSGRDILATVNGLSCSTSYLGLELSNLLKKLRWIIKSIACAHLALGAKKDSFSSLVNDFPVRNFRGQSMVARTLRDLVANIEPVNRSTERQIQDEYSIRCVPQILGPIWEVLIQSKKWIEQELNSVSDNPVMGDCPEEISSGGNFFGGYITWAADNMLQCIAKLGELLERQTFLLVDGKHDLPTNLVGAHNLDPTSHGLKGVHQLCNALAMELKYGGVPAKLFTHSCEGHNQDIVSNAMNATVRLSRQNQILSELIAAHSLLAFHALSLSEAKIDNGHADMIKWIKKMRKLYKRVDKDRPLREDLKNIGGFINNL